MKVSRVTKPTVVVAAAILVAALGLRAWEVQRTAYRPINDAGAYLKLASEVARTGDFSTSHAPGVGAGGTRGPSAYFPPAYPYFLGAVDLIDGHATRRDGAINPARLSQALLGTIIVGLVGLVAFEAFGTAPPAASTAPPAASTAPPAASTAPLPVSTATLALSGGATLALTAMALAAIYPVLIELSGSLVAENLFTAVVLAATWAGAPSCPLGTPIPVDRRGRLPHRAGRPDPLQRRPACAAADRGGDQGKAGICRARPPVAIARLTVTPWIVRNAIVMDSFVPVSDETGITLVGTCNAASAAYRPVPYKWRIYYGIPGERSLIRRSHRMTELQLSRRLQSQALDYISAHPLAPLQVTFYNSLRLLELEGRFAWRASTAAIDLPGITAEVGVASFWLLCLLSMAGLFTRAVHMVPRWLWTVPVPLWLSVAVVNAETPRFREPVDPFLLLLAALALVTAAAWVRSRLGGAPIRGQAGAARAHAAEPV